MSDGPGVTTAPGSRGVRAAVGVGVASISGQVLFTQSHTLRARLRHGVVLGQNPKQVPQSPHLGDTYLRRGVIQRLCSLGGGILPSLSVDAQKGGAATDEPVRNMALRFLCRPRILSGTSFNSSALVSTHTAAESPGVSLGGP